jgi:transcription elongation GreA/GreB family factor
MEEDKAHGQLQQALAVRRVLQGIDPGKVHERVETGSLVGTSNGYYFISVGVGKVRLDNDVYYCISIESPIGQLLKGLKIGDEARFREQEINIQFIV